MMHGDGILTKAEGGSYTGSFWKGARHGMGIEVFRKALLTATVRFHLYSAQQTFGNIVNKTFVCPMGHKHKGDGYCQYTGPFKLNYFEGENISRLHVCVLSCLCNCAVPSGEGGTFTCCDGRSYTGNWLRGKRHGKVRLRCGLIYGAE